MANARRLVAKANNSKVVSSVIVMALVFGSCVANGEYLGGRRGLAANSGNPTVFDITKFGAVGDGKTNSFKAFLNSWIQVCASPAPATLLDPKGEFLAGPVIFAGPCKIAKSPSKFMARSWLQQADSHHPNGSYSSVWTISNSSEPAHSTAKVKPSGKLVDAPIKRIVVFPQRFMKNVDISGITSVNSKGFHMFLVQTSNVNVHGIKIIAPAESPNTDGIHLSNADHVRIVDSTIGTGDDCVSVGRGSNNVTVERVVCGPGHGLSVGSLGKYKNEENVSGIHIKQCTMRDTDNGLRIKTWGGSDPSKAMDISFEDITMQNVKNPIIIDQNYGSRGGDSKVEISNVLFKNVKGTTISKDIVQIMCSNNANVIFGGQLSFPMCPK